MTTSATYYAAMADRMERDPINGPGVNGRATVPNGQGFAMWRRFHKDDAVWVDDVDGTPRWLTRTQCDLVGLLSAMTDGTIVHMREMAVILKVAPSTVSRGMVKLASFGLVTYTTSRGRHGGTIVYRMVGEQFKDVRALLRNAAKAKIRAWREAAEKRISRLKVNVASFYSMREMEGIGGYYLPTYYVLKDATLKQPWTAEEIAEALGEV